jgi:hypothetical protein
MGNAMKKKVISDKEKQLEKFILFYDNDGRSHCQDYKNYSDAKIPEYKTQGFIGASVYESDHMTLARKTILSTVFWSGTIKSVQEAFNLGWIDKTQYASFYQKKHTWVHYHNQKILSGTGEYRLCS